MLELDSVTVAYGEAIALHDVSLTVEEGQVVALLGSNGAGKTTMIKAIMRMLPIRGGNIRLAGVDLATTDPSDMPQLGVALVPEGRRLFAEMNVIDNLRMGGFHPSLRDELDEGLSYVFELFPVLNGRQRQTAGTLSGGEQQMVALGRALIGRPKLLLLDEPSLGLAPLIVSQVFETIQSVCERGMTVLLAEQNVRRALAIADVGHVLNDGRLEVSGQATELLERDDVRRAYLGG